MNVSYLTRVIAASCLLLNVELLLVVKICKNKDISVHMQPSPYFSSRTGLGLLICKNRAFYLKSADKQQNNHSPLDRRSEQMCAMKCFIKYPKYCDFPIENLPYGVFSTKDDVSTSQMKFIDCMVLMLLNHSLAVQLH